MSILSRATWVACAATLALLACGQKPENPPPAPAPVATPVVKAAVDPFAPPSVFEAVTVPADNPMSAEKVALGKQLFFDPRLSGDGSRSCYSCHVCEKGLTDGLALAVGAFAKPLTRSSPPLWNMAYHSEFYWDGRSKSLEAQAMAAWKGGNMGADPDASAAQLNQIPGYQEQFQRVFGGDATPDLVVKAISAFERTIFCGDTAFDRWQGGDEGAAGDDVKRGWAVFREKAGCGSCHAGALFTDLKFHNVGAGAFDNADVGRHKVTTVETDTGAFKTPSLRDVGRSAPYFHDGSVATLEAAVDFMLDGGKDNPHLDRVNLKKVELSAEDRSDLLAFLRALDCDCKLEAPPLPGI